MLVTAVAATLQGSIGLGFAIVSVPILSLIDPRLAPVPQLLLSLPLAMSMAWRERHAVELKGVVWVLLGRIPGAVLGVLVLKLATPRVLDGIIGGIVLFAAAVLGTGLTIKRNKLTELLAGVASGVAGLVSSMSGPPLGLLYQREKGESIRANLALIFSIGITISITARVLSDEITRTDLTAAAVLLPGLFAGYLVSYRLKGKIEGRGLRMAVLGVCVLAAIGLMVRALRG